MSLVRASLLAGVPYAAAVAWLLGEALAFPLLAFGWVFALVATDEPRLTSKYGRQADVGWFQRTPPGAALTYRRGWVPAKAHGWVWPCALVLLVAPGAVGAWWAWGAPADLAAIAKFTGYVLASPIAVLSAASFTEDLLVQPLIAPFVGLGVLVALIASLNRPGPLFGRVVTGLLVSVWVVFALDLVRLLRRRPEGAL